MKKKIILFIDTSDNKKTKVSLESGGKKISKTAKSNWSSQMLLPLIEELLTENRLKLSDLTEIKVNSGPGSFTGLRVGAAVANTLSYILDIPVNGSKKRLVSPKY